jgi:hypothetical protein
MSENKILRRIFVLKGESVTGGRRQLHNEEVHNLYSSSDITRMTNSRTMRWLGSYGTHKREVHTSFARNTWREETIRKVQT